MAAQSSPAPPLDPSGSTMAVVGDASSVYGEGQRGLFALDDIQPWTVIADSVRPIAFHRANKSDKDENMAMFFLTRDMIGRRITLENLIRWGITKTRPFHPKYDKEQASAIISIKDYDKSYQLAIRANAYAYFCTTPYSWIAFGIALYGEEISSINHSCSPNSYLSFGLEGECTLISFKPIGKGEEITVAYNPNIPWCVREERTAMMVRRLGIVDCRCSRCTAPAQFDVLASTREEVVSHFNEDERDQLERVDSAKTARGWNYQDKIRCINLFDDVCKRIKPRDQCGQPLSTEDRLLLDQLRFLSLGEVGDLFKLFIRGGQREVNIGRGKKNRLILSLERTALYSPDPQFVLSASAAALVLTDAAQRDTAHQRLAHFFSVQIGTKLPRAALEAEIRCNKLLAELLYKLVGLKS